MRLLLIFLFFTISINAQWNQKGLDIDGAAADDRSGRAVSISSDGNIVAIGASLNDNSGIDAGHVRIFEWNGSIWTQKGLDINGEYAGDYSGCSVSLSNDGNIIAIGAQFNSSDKGHVRIYEWSGTNWLQKGTDIIGEGYNDRSGYCVSIDSTGSIVAIGAPGNGDAGTLAGHVRVYEWGSNDWIQKGSDLDGEAGSDFSGKSVSINSNGNIVAIGAEYNDGAGASSGHVRVYEWGGNDWVQKGLDIDGEAVNDYSGCAVSVCSDGNTIAIGAHSNDGIGNASGHVRVYHWSGTNWIQKGLDIDGEAASNLSGSSVSINSDGNIVAIGAPSNYNASGFSGHVRIYQWNGTTWNQIGDDIDGEATDDDSGEYQSVSISSDGITIAIGAYKNDGAGNESGHVRVYEFCNMSSSVDSITACNSYVWMDGNTYNANNNTATHVLTNSIGCDSVITLNLTINSVNNSVTQNGVVLSADLSGATYQWLDCDNNFSIIPGDTNQNFTATSNGNYAVQIIENGCVDTSACYAVNSVEYIENVIKDVEVYPNPTSGMINLKGLNTLTGISHIHLLDSKGALIKDVGINVNKIDLSSLSKGIYFIEIKHQLGTGRIKIVNQ